MKNILFSLLATVFIASFAHADSSMKKIRLGTEGAYPPYNFINDKGEVDGFEREFGDRICKIAKLDCVWVANDWDTIIPNLLSGNYDAIIAGMQVTAERKKVIDFSEEYFPAGESAYIALKGSSMNVIKGIVAAQKGTVQASYVADSEATVVEFATVDELISAVRSGEVDAAFADKPSLQKAVEESRDEIVFIKSIKQDDGMAIGFRKSDAELRKKFNAAIEVVKKDGSLSKMIAKWFDGKVVKF